MPPILGSMGRKKAPQQKARLTFLFLLHWSHRHLALLAKLAESIKLKATFFLQIKHPRLVEWLKQ
jgi:hypothetical protein